MSRPYTPRGAVKVVSDAAAAIEAFARTDAGAKVGLGSATSVDRCVVLYTTRDAMLGYASWGVDRTRCGEAKRLADAAYAMILDRFEDLTTAPLRSALLGDADRVDLVRLGDEVRTAMHMLAATVDPDKATEMPPEIRAAIKRDMVVPIATLAARIVMCFEIQRGAGGDDEGGAA